MGASFLIYMGMFHNLLHGFQVFNQHSFTPEDPYHEMGNVSVCATFLYILPDPLSRYYRQVYFVYSGLQDESLQVTVGFFNLHRGGGGIFLHRGHPVNVPIRRIRHPCK